MKDRHQNLEELHWGASQSSPSANNVCLTEKLLNQTCNRTVYLGIFLSFLSLGVALLSVLSCWVQMFSDNSHCPDCGQQWFPSLELGHWLYQTELVENECYQVFLDRINRADYCPECYPDNPANRSLVLPWSFPLEWAPQNLTRWTFEKACHPFLLGPPLLRKRIHDSRVAGFNPALQLILTRTDKTLNKKLGQNK